MVQILTGMTLHYSKVGLQLPSLSVSQRVKGKKLHKVFKIELVPTSYFNQEQKSVITSKFFFWQWQFLNVYTYLCFLLLGCLGASSAGFLNMSRNIGSNFLNITVETAKFLSNLSTLSRNSCERLAMSAHFFILLKNWIKLRRKTTR